MNSVEVRPGLTFGAGPLVLIAGPCVIESEEHVHFLARAIRNIAGDFVFKASFDKAIGRVPNRRADRASTKGCGFWRACAGKVSRSSPTSTRAGRRSAPPRPPTSCKSLRFFAGRLTFWWRPAGPPGGEHQKRPVRRAARHATRGGKGGRDRQSSHPADGARFVFRLQQPGG